MALPRWSTCVLAVILGACVIGAAQARVIFHEDELMLPDFALLGAPALAARRTEPARAPSLPAGSTVVVLPDGALVVEADSGQLVRTDREGNPVARLEIGVGAGLLVHDEAARLAYVALRLGDRIQVIDTAGGRLAAVRAIATRAEPYGVALTPDKKTLLVTTVADHALSAYDAQRGDERWSVDVGPEPRGVAVSPDGRQAVVTSLATGALAFVDLRDRRTRWVALDTRTGGRGPGTRFARNAWAALYLDEATVVAPHQLSLPQQLEERENRGAYGGGGPFPPIAHRMTFATPPAAPAAGSSRTVAAEVSLFGPRALAYDAARDVLYVAGHGDDTILALGEASQPSIHLLWKRIAKDDSRACAPSGLAVRGRDVLVFCEQTRRVAVLRRSRPDAQFPEVAWGPEVAPSRLSASAVRGRDLFRRGGDTRLSGGGAMACASCHPEGRTDGLSWRIEGHNLQTPILAGRLSGTHPFKWDGKDRTLKNSLVGTVKRLGGSGLSQSDARDLDAYLASLPRPRAPTPRDPAAVARGKALFLDGAGCAGCHAGDRLTNGRRYDLARDLDDVDTPSLIGVAASAPYYHDGSAGTLRALLLGNASVHGMGRAGKLDDRQVTDLVAYLETL